MQRSFSTFIGIDLGGARGKTTALARLTCSASEPGVIAEVVSPRHGDIDPWHDSVLLEYIAEQPDSARTVIALNAPLTVPACIRCLLPVCPGKQACVDPAVIWLRTEGETLVEETLDRDLDRIVAIPETRLVGRQRRSARPPRAKPHIEPYVHRAAEVLLHYQRGLLPRDTLGIATGPIAARAIYLRRALATLNYELNRNLIEVSPRGTVHALFGPRMARGYKRDADPWETRAAIIEKLDSLRFSRSSRLSREEVLRNDHCFEALLSGYTAYLWARDGWKMPEGIFAEDGWVWTPPE